MPWTHCETATTHAETLDHALRTRARLSEVVTVPYCEELLASWCVLEDLTEAGEAFIACVLTGRDPESGVFRHKEIREAEGPAVRGCPVEFLDLAPLAPGKWAPQFRRAVRADAEHARSLRALGIDLASKEGPMRPPKKRALSAAALPFREFLERIEEGYARAGRAMQVHLLADRIRWALSDFAFDGDADALEARLETAWEEAAELGREDEVEQLLARRREVLRVGDRVRVVCRGELVPEAPVGKTFRVVGFTDPFGAPRGVVDGDDRGAFGVVLDPEGLEVVGRGSHRTAPAR